MGSIKQYIEIKWLTNSAWTDSHSHMISTFRVTTWGQRSSTGCKITIAVI